MAWVNSIMPDLAWHYSPTPFTPKWCKKNGVGWNKSFTANWYFTPNLALVGDGLSHYIVFISMYYFSHSIFPTGVLLEGVLMRLT